MAHELTFLRMLSEWQFSDGNSFVETMGPLIRMGSPSFFLSSTNEAIFRKNSASFPDAQWQMNGVPKWVHNIWQNGPPVGNAFANRLAGASTGEDGDNNDADNNDADTNSV